MCERPSIERGRAYCGYGWRKMKCQAVRSTAFHLSGACSVGWFPMSRVDGVERSRRKNCEAEENRARAPEADHERVRQGERAAGAAAATQGALHHVARQRVGANALASSEAAEREVREPQAERAAAARREIRSR